GTRDAPALVAQEGQRYPVIRAHRSRLASVSARLPQLVEKLSETADHLNDVLDEKNRQALANTLAHLETFAGGLAERNNDIAEFTSNANEATQVLATLLHSVDHSYSDPGGYREVLGTGLANFDRLAKNLVETNRQLQVALQDVRPGLRGFAQRTLSDIGDLVGDARQLISGLSR